MAEKVVIGNCELWHGDCREVLPLLPPVDLVLTDPPYGIKRFEKGFGTTRFKGHGAEKTGIEWDKRPEKELFDQLLAFGAVSIIWGSNNFPLPTSEYFLVWDKCQTVDNFASAELAFTNAKRPAKVFRYSIHQHNCDERDKAHPTQKPVPLMEWCLSLVSEAKTVCDPFMGSGTTGVACARMGLQFVGIERERKYFDLACERITRAQAQGKLLPPDPRLEAVQAALLPANPDFDDPLPRH